MELTLTIAAIHRCYTQMSDMPVGAWSWSADLQDKHKAPLLGFGSACDNTGWVSWHMPDHLAVASA